MRKAVSSLKLFVCWYGEKVKIVYEIEYRCVKIILNE